MNVKEAKIVGNMVALARKQPKSKRSAMLRMVMPYLSRDNGDMLADAIADKDTAKFEKVWNRIKLDISKKIDSKHKSTSSSHSPWNSLEAHLKRML